MCDHIFHYAFLKSEQLSAGSASPFKSRCESALGSKSRVSPGLLKVSWSTTRESTEEPAAPSKTLTQGFHIHGLWQEEEKYEMKDP